MYVGSLNLAILGIFTPWKLSNVTNQGFLSRALEKTLNTPHHLIPLGETCIFMAVLLVSAETRPITYMLLKKY